LHRSILTAAVVGAAAALAGFAPAPVAATGFQRPEDGAEYKKIIDTAGESLVTVKFVMKAPDDQGMGDQEEEINGVVIDSKGLVLCSHWFLGGAANMFGGGAGPKPQDIRVLIGDDTEGKKARLISHDSELDLAWIKLEEEPATALKFIDLEKGTAGSVGQRVFLLSRMDKYFDRSPVVNEGRLRGETTKPRRLFAPGGGLLADRNDIGLPVFNADAGVVGFMIVQVPDRESMEATENIGGGPMVLPIEDVARATKKALEAQNNPAEGAKTEEAPAAPAEKKD
jgi:hypothetical protein